MLEVVFVIGVSALWLISLVNIIGLVFYDTVVIERPYRVGRRVPGDRLIAVVELLTLTTALVAWTFFRLRDVLGRKKR